MERVEVELLEYIEDHFSKTRYPTIYGIGGIGFSWTVLKVDRAGSNRPTIIVPWRGHITSNRSYSLLENVADEIHAMSAQEISTCVVNVFHVRVRIHSLLVIVDSPNCGFTGSIFQRIVIRLKVRRCAFRRSPASERSPQSRREQLTLLLRGQ